MIFRTENSFYEVSRRERRFRRLQRDPHGRIVPEGGWQTFEHVGAIAVGDRVRFFLPGSEAHDARTWTTTPVRELLAAV